jgi:hypothetical protein
VIDETVDLGAQVTLQTHIATLVGTDEYWIRTSVPVDELRWLHFPRNRDDQGSAALIRQNLGNGFQGEWSGRVDRLMGDLEPQGRMARVLVSVKDPLRLNSPDGEKQPLLIGAYVNVFVEGQKLEDVIAVPRTALRNDDSVWVMGDDDRLDIREVEVIRRNSDTVLVRSGLEDGERLVLSDLPAPVRGMGLALQSDPAADSGDDELAYRTGEGTEHAQSE